MPEKVDCGWAAAAYIAPVRKKGGAAMNPGKPDAFRKPVNLGKP